MEINGKNDKILYDIDEGIIKKRINGQWLQSPNVDKTLSNGIIPNNDTNINTKYSPNASNDTTDISMLESRKGNTLSTQKAQETLQSARLVGMSDVDVNKAIALKLCVLLIRLKI